MQRHEMMTAMAELGLKGMAGAFDEAVTTGLQRKRTTMEVLTDLLRAEAAHRHAASVRYRMSAARLPAVKDLDAFVFNDTPINEGLVRSLHSGSFLPGRRNVVLVGGTGTGKTHLATAITANVVRAGARGRYFNTVDLVNRLEEETRLGKAGALAAQLSRLDLVVLDELGYLLNRQDDVAEVRSASDATGALRELNEHRIDAIFLDINMPGLSGLELAGVLAKYASPPAIVFVTAHDDRAVDAFAVGATDVVGTEAVWSDDEPPEPPDEHAVAPNSAAPATVRNPRRSMGVPSSVTCPLALRPVRAGSG